MPRPDPFADEQFCQSVAEGFALGLSRQQMCDEFGVADKSTITRWRRDPRIKARMQKILQDRIMQITRRVDTLIERRLEDGENLSTRDLIMIRREFLGGQLREQSERADDATIGEAAAALEADPALLDKMMDLLQNGSSRTPKDDFVPADESPFEEPIGDTDPN